MTALVLGRTSAEFVHCTPPHGPISVDPNLELPPLPPPFHLSHVSITTLAMATEAEPRPEGQPHTDAHPDTPADSAQKPPVKRSWR